MKDKIAVQCMNLTARALKKQTHEISWDFKLNVECCSAGEHLKAEKPHVIKISKLRWLKRAKIQEQQH